VCEGGTLKVFNTETNQLIATETVPFRAASIEVAPFDPSVFLVWASKACRVYFLVEAGLELLNDIAMDQTKVISVTWLPFELFHLAVVSDQVVKVFDILHDSTSPAYVVVCPDRIDSLAFFENDRVGYLAVGCHSGRVGVCRLNSSCNIEKFISLPASFKPVYVSCSTKTKIFFISSPSSTLLVCRPSELLNETRLQHFSICRLENCALNGGMVFATTHPQNRAVHMLRMVQSGAVVMLEFTDSGISCNLIPFAGGETAGRSHQIGVFEMRNTVGTIGADGHLYELVAREPISRVDFARTIAYPLAHEAEEDGFDFKVPASFWCGVRTEPGGVHVTDELGVEFNWVIGRQRHTISQNHIKLYFRTISRNRVIAGFGVGVAMEPIESVPLWMKIQNRKFLFERKVPRRYCFALKESEAYPGAFVRMEFESEGPELLLDGIEVYVTDSAGFPSPRELSTDWKFGTRDLKAFVDSGEEDCDSQIAFVIVSLSAARFRNEGPDREAVIGLVKLMYSDRRYANACRRTLLKAGGSDIEDMWAEGIRQVCDAKAVDPGMIDLLWRDYCLLGEEHQKKVGDVIWNIVGNGTSVFAFLSALTS
jgi:hypothetical protein